MEFLPLSVGLPMQRLDWTRLDWTGGLLQVATPGGFSGPTVYRLLRGRLERHCLTLKSLQSTAAALQRGIHWYGMHWRRIVHEEAIMPNKVSWRIIGHKRTPRLHSSLCLHPRPSQAFFPSLASPYPSHISAAETFQHSACLLDTFNSNAESIYKNKCKPMGNLS